MKNSQINVPVFIRVNGIVVTNFGNITVRNDLYGQTICIDYPNTQHLHYKMVLEEGILYCDLLVPEYMSTALPVEECKAMINMSLTGVIKMMPVKDILLIVGCKNFVSVGLANNTEDITYRGLTGLVNELPPEYFIQINRSMIIAKKNIVLSFNGKFATLIACSGKTYSISNTFKNAYFIYWEQKLLAYSIKGNKKDLIIQ